jgi:hypothetical protein
LVGFYKYFLSLTLWTGQGENPQLPPLREGGQLALLGALSCTKRKGIQMLLVRWGEPFDTLASGVGTSKILNHGFYA